MQTKNIFNSESEDVWQQRPAFIIYWQWSNLNDPAFDHNKNYNINKKHVAAGVLCVTPWGLISIKCIAPNSVKKSQRNVRSELH